MDSFLGKLGSENEEFKPYFPWSYTSEFLAHRILEFVVVSPVIIGHMNEALLQSSWNIRFHLTNCRPYLFQEEKMFTDADPVISNP